LEANWSYVILADRESDIHPQGALHDHHCAQARRLADCTIFLNTEKTESGGLIGYLAESGETETLFETPQA
jgi:ABC-type phosphate transport system ATPase subunit